MSSKIEILLNGEALKEERLIEVDPGASHQEIIETFHRETNANGSVEDYKIFFERVVGDDVEVIKEEVKIITHRSRIHCHRCERISISVAYQNETKIIVAEPSESIGELTKKACDDFSIQPADATKLVLKLGDDDLPINGHIGTYVNYPDCKISLALTPFTKYLG